MYKFNFVSNNEFVFKYSFYDEYDEIINNDSNWKKERIVNKDLIIKKAEIDFNNNMANIQFTPNYINSSTKYFIIIGHYNETVNFKSFDNPCFLIKLITENSLGIKIYEAISIGEKDIDVNIDISDLISKNSENKDYIVNIVSLELRFDKKLNFYKSRLFGKPIQIQINEDINFVGKNLFYELEYKRPNNVSEYCVFLCKPNSSDIEITIEFLDLNKITFNLKKDVAESINFECCSDGTYSINIHTISEETLQGSFKMISTGFYFDLDLSKYDRFYIFPFLDYQPSPLIINIDTSKLGQDSLINIIQEEIELFIKDDNYKNMSLNNEFCFFEKDKNYQIFIRFSELGEEGFLFNYFDIQSYLDYNFEELSFSTKKYNNIYNTFLKISYKNTPKIIFETEPKGTIFLISYISESDYNIFPKKIQELEFTEISDLKTKKPNDFDYAILLIKFNSNKENTIVFIDGRVHLDIELNNIYNIEDEFILYYLNFDSIKNDEILIVFYSFDKEYTGEITIKSDEYNNKVEIDNKLKGSIYFEVATKKIYEFYFYNLKENYGKFKIISTGNLFKMNIKDFIIFDEMITQKETSHLIFNFDILEKNYNKNKYK